MDNKLPDGYRVIKKKQNSVIVGMFNFMLMFEDAKPVITYDGKQYKCGLLEVIPKALHGHCCSCREYTLIN